MASIFSASSLHTTIDTDEGEEQLWRVEIRDLARAFCGALFVALPLHFTMEMWERARVMPVWVLLLLLPATYFINVGFALFSGYKSKIKRQAIWFDAFVAMGVGLLAATITLLLIDQLTYQQPLTVSLKTILLEMIPTSFGASMAKSQLGGGNSQEGRDLTDAFSPDFRKITGATLGALIFSFNIAATQEPILIATSIKSYQVVGLILFSLFVSYLMIFVADFAHQDGDQGGIMGDDWAETTICYVLSLGISALLLWVFGYLTAGVPLHLALTWIVVLGYATTLGGSAGRLVL